MTHAGNTFTLHAPCTPPVSLNWGRAVDVLDGGNHHPLLCHLEGPSGPAGLWVVKPYDVMSTGNRRDGKYNIMAELAAAEVCAVVGLPTPEVGLVRFPAHPAEELYCSIPENYRAEVRAVFEINKGKLAFCCMFVSYASDLDPGVLSGAYGKSFTEQWGALLFAVDAYIRHDDRTVDNPNALQLGNSTVPIDHGAAFAKIADRGMTGADLARQTYVQAQPAYRRHIFYEPLKRYSEGIDWISVRDRLALIDDDTIAKASIFWPTELEPARSRFVDFLAERQKHIDTIVTQLERLTSEPGRAG